jgi:hypothetical protein
MFSQSLLFAPWRATAAPPDSSASSQAETTPGSSPVSAASREANRRWSEVSIVPVADGSVLELVAPEEPTALESRSVKLDPELPDSASEAEVPPVMPSADVAVEAAGENAVCRLASCAWIWPICCSTVESWLMASV